MKHSLLFAAAASFLPLSAQAATFFQADEAAFLAATAGERVIVERFDTSVEDGTLVNDATFETGIAVTPNAPSADNDTRDGFIRLSTDNATGANVESPFTNTITIDLPNPTTFLSLVFGGNDGRGIGNNSGTQLTIGSTVIDFSSLPGINQGAGDYEGFFGFTSDVAFSSIQFAGLNLGSSTDDDFSVDDITFAAPAPVPVPAGLPLLATGLLAFGALRRRRARG